MTIAAKGDVSPGLEIFMNCNTSLSLIELRLFMGGLKSRLSSRIQKDPATRIGCRGLSRSFPRGNTRRARTRDYRNRTYGNKDLSFLRKHGAQWAPSRINETSPQAIAL